MNARVETEMLESIAALWREVLCRQDVGLDDDFFDVGGDSLSLAELLVRLEAFTGKRLPPRLIYDTDSARALATWLAHATVRAS